MNIAMQINSREKYYGYEFFYIVMKKKLKLQYKGRGLNK